MTLDNHGLPFNCFCFRDSFCSGACLLGWSENNFFFEIEKSVVLKTCQTGKIYEKNWFWRVATFGGLATPQNVF